MIHLLRHLRACCLLILLAGMLLPVAARAHTGSIAAPDGRSGRGVLVESTRNFWTAAHVVDLHEHVEVRLDGVREPVRGRVAQIWPDRDLARIELEINLAAQAAPGGIHPAVRGEEPANGALVATGGAARTALADGVGHWSRLSWNERPVRLTTLIARPGDSGSAVFDEGGRVVGLVLGALRMSGHRTVTRVALLPADPQPDAGAGAPRPGEGPAGIEKAPERSSNH